MLVVTRKCGEAIVIPRHGIVVRVVKVGNQVRLGIEAPDEVAVFRQEIWDMLRHDGFPPDEEAERKDEAPRPH